MMIQRKHTQLFFFFSQMICAVRYQTKNNKKCFSSCIQIQLDFIDIDSLFFQRTCLMFNGVKLYRILAQLNSSQISFISNDFFLYVCFFFCVLSSFLSNLRSFRCNWFGMRAQKCLMKWTFNASHDIADAFAFEHIALINDIFCFHFRTYTLTHELLPNPLTNTVQHQRQFFFFKCC